MLKIDPKSVSQPELHQYMLGTIAPRPIAFVSTVDEKGHVNLAPYSFFNAFSSNPPIIVFSSNRRGSDNSTKDTLANVIEKKEAVINIVSYEYARQLALASINYPSGINEFDKAGFTEVSSDRVSTPRVKEATASFECVVKDIISLGDNGGAGNLIICEVVMMHLDKSILDEDGKIDHQKVDLIGRMGRAYYTKAGGESIFKIYQPVNVIGMGMDNLPEHIRKSEILSGNSLAALAAFEELPDSDEVESFKTDPRIKQLVERCKNNQDLLQRQSHQLAIEMMEQDKIDDAWKTLMIDYASFQDDQETSSSEELKN